MKQFLKLLLGFAPWIAFLAMAQGGLARLKTALVAAAVLSLGMAVLRLHRGVILWAGMAFFVYASVAVLAFEHLWTIRNMAVLVQAALAAGIWLALLLGRPFTLDYAREQTDPSLWEHPVFLRTNRILASAWGAVFTLNTGVAWLKTHDAALPWWGYEIVSNAFLLSAIAVSTVYPERVRRREARAGKAD